MSHFRPCDRDTPYLLPPSLDDWLPKDHLARFVADLVAQLDLSALISRYHGAGSAAYQPGMLLVLLLYGYATGLTQAPNDKQQITPMLETLGALPEELGEVNEILADAGYYSEANVRPPVSRQHRPPDRHRA